MRPLAKNIRGFTLIEAIVVMVLTGILSSIVVFFMRNPINAYVDMGRRAQLTDIADTAFRRMSRDIHLALPNSVRNPVNGSDQCLELMPTKTGGRYRLAQSSLGTGDMLDFTMVDTSFDMLGSNASLPAAEQIATNDIIVVFNDGSTNGNAYTGVNAIQVASVGAGGTSGTSGISFIGSGTLFGVKQFPNASPANRFQVLSGSEHAAAYYCDGNGTLFRYSRTLSSSWPTPANCAAMIAGGSASILATNVATCSMTYQPPGSGTGVGRFGIVNISLSFTLPDPSGRQEAINLYQIVKVDNTP